MGDESSELGDLRRIRELIQAGCICVISQVMRWTEKQQRKVYEHLASLNTGFDAARNALAAFRDLRGFERSEIERLFEITAEARAIALSYLTNVIEGVETDEAARLQNRRLRRERRDSEG